VAGLLAAAGLCLLVPALSNVPDRVRLIFDGIQMRYVPALVVSTVVSILVGAACIGVAYLLYTGDAPAGPLAFGYGLALLLALVFGNGRRGAETLALVLLGVAMAVLVLAPATKPLLPWSWEELGRADAPRSVRAVWVMARALSVVVGAIGAASLLTFSNGNLAGGTGFVTGSVLCAAAVVGIGSLQPVRAGSVNGRLALTGAMGCVFVAILLDHLMLDVPVWTAVPLLLMALAVVVILLLWLPTESQGHFVHAGLPYAQFGAKSVPAAARGPSGAAGPGVGPGAGPVPVPPAPLTAAPPPPPPTMPPARPPVFHQAVGVAFDATTARSAELDLTYDQQSWFATPEPGERVLGALLVSMLMVADDTGAPPVFQGTSTLLVTDRRLVGVCPKGSSAYGPLDTTHGPVVLWSAPIAVLARIEPGSSSSGPHVAIGRAGGPSPWLLLARPRVADGGSFRAAEMAELFDILRRAAG
jgi:hypothetical protein